ncbi:MAG: EFR1 family ferrodoxin [Candidatus Methanomethylophilaceae archaeon]|nr:EFR1 family ferrodoxin [Candidatus Methanomethylophilaceae archaeon]
MILTFSATGNSYHVARRISDATGIPMVDMGAAERYHRHLYDAKGEDVHLVFPVYYHGLPAVVSRFAERLEVRNPGRVVCTVTCAGESGAACEMLQERLGDRLTVDAMYDVRMPDSSITYSDVFPEPDVEGILSDAEARVDEIIGSILAGESGDHRTMASTDHVDEVHPLYKEARSTEPFAINDRCVECRICEDVCPEGVIRIYHRKPVWDEPECSHCMCCANLCPKAAIEYGDGTAGKGRYHHPDYHVRVLGMPLRW